VFIIRHPSIIMLMQSLTFLFLVFFFFFGLLLTWQEINQLICNSNCTISYFAKYISSNHGNLLSSNIIHHIFFLDSIENYFHFHFDFNLSLLLLKKSLIYKGITYQWIGYRKKPHRSSFAYVHAWATKEEGTLKKSTYSSPSEEKLSLGIT